MSSVAAIAPRSGDFVSAATTLAADGTGTAAHGWLRTPGALPETGRECESGTSSTYTAIPRWPCLCHSAARPASATL